MKHLLFIFLFCSVCVQAQFRITGIIKDQTNQKPLPFVTIETNTGIVSTSDVTGKFEISCNSTLNSLIFSYIGYETLTLYIKDKKHLSVLLIPKKTNLNATLPAFENDEAVVLIEKVIEKQDFNNPQKKLSNFLIVTFSNSFKNRNIKCNPRSFAGNGVHEDATVDVLDSFFHE